MLQVPIDKIVPLTTARDTLSKIIADVETGTPMYIFTKNGKPSVAVISIDYLQKQMGPIHTMPAMPALSADRPAAGPAAPTVTPTQTVQIAKNVQTVEQKIETPTTDFWGQTAAQPAPTQPLTTIPTQESPPTQSIPPTKSVDPIAAKPAPTAASGPTPTAAPAHEEPPDMEIG